ncbi:MAG: potassium transporter TrkA [Methanomassiliicoccales archaeon]|nr:MAG: potassium transporter TrkA [Methanomassiliicoccales archaeon]
MPWKKEEFEGIEYEPTSVKELLTEMKDVSELIIDLAYSAVVFDSKEIGEEVSHLESKMDMLKYKIRLASMLAARTTEEAEQLTGILQVASAAETIANAAGDMVKLLDIDIESRPFIPSILKDADEKINTTEITSSSSLSNRILGELSLESELGVRIIAIRRMKKWIYDPEDDARLKAGDRLIVRGVMDGFLRLKSIAAGQRAWEERDVDISRAGGGGK